jgi:O-antigen ligase
VRQVTRKAKLLGNYLTSSRVEGQLATLVLVLVLGCYPIVGTSTVMLGIPSTPVSISYRAIYLAMCLFVLLIELLRLPYRKIPVTIVAIVVFWLIYGCRLYYDFYIVELDKGYARKGPLYFFQYGFGGSLFPAITISLLQKNINWTKAFTLTRYAFVVSCLSILAYVIFIKGFNISIFYQRLRLGEDNVIGPILMSQTGGALLTLVVMEKVLQKRSSILLLSQGGVGLLLLIMGGSRGPLLATIIVIVLLTYQAFLWDAKKLKFWGNILLIMLVAIAGFIKVILPNIDSIVLFNRLDHAVNNGAGPNLREEQWASAWQQFLDNPILGDQIIERAQWFYPHNFILEVLMATGLAGGVFIAFTLANWGWKFINRKSIDLSRWWTFYFFILFFLYASFSQSMINLTQFWVLLAACTSFSLSRTNLNEE